MKAHHVRLADHPEAAPHLAAMFTACAGGITPISGRTVSGSREKLAALVGEPLATVLRAGKPIRVKPKNTTVWLVIDEAGEPRADYNLARVIRAEMKAQGLSERAVSEKAGASQKAVNNLLSATASPSWWLVRGVLLALGKDLRWLAEQLAEPDGTDAP